MRRTAAVRQSLNRLEALGWSVETNLDGSYWCVRMRHSEGLMGGCHGSGGERGLAEGLEWLVENDAALRQKR